MRDCGLWPFVAGMMVGGMLVFLVLAMIGSAGAAVPAICGQLPVSSPAWRALCSPDPAPPIVPNLPGRGLTCDATAAASLTFNGFCQNWAAYRQGQRLIIACSGQPAPAGAAPMICLGDAAACGRQ